MTNDPRAVDLHVDQVYGGSRVGNATDDPLPALVGVSSGAGFRYLGSKESVSSLKMLVLKTDFADRNWPDSIDRERGLFVYYGDKREAGDLHETKRWGNKILRALFEEAHNAESSAHFPPILLFGNTGNYRDVKFLGLAVPGAAGLTSDEDLVAVWRTSKVGVRFQNYCATFTIVDAAAVTRAWLGDAFRGDAVTSPHAPQNWLRWVKHRSYRALRSTPSSRHRSKAEQLPDTPSGTALLAQLHDFYQADARGFEFCAMEIARILMPNIKASVMTRPWRDGGRDAYGLYQLGVGAGALDVEFALEAKCYGPRTGVGVRYLSRLISRLRHRQFGILITTSYLSDQAYQELLADAHPVVVVAGKDIVELLTQKFGSWKNIETWLKKINIHD